MLAYGRMRRILAGLGLLVMLGALLPAAALAAPPAQDTIDPDVVAAVQAAAVLVTNSVGRGSAGASADLPVEPTPEVTPEATPAVTPEVTPEATAEVTPTTFTLPTEDDFDEFNSSGISILAPRQWNVETDSEDTPFSMSDKAAGLEVQVQDFGTEFPGLLIFPIFEANAESLVASFGEDAQLADVSRIEVEQGVPTLRIGFTATDSDSGAQKGGVVYIYATGSSALGLMGGSDIEFWPELEPLVDEIARSVILDDARINIETAGADGLAFSDPDGAFTLTAPAGWLVSPIADSDLRVVVANPEITAVGALALETDISVDDPQLQVLTEAVAGALSSDDAQSFADQIVQLLDLGAEDMTIDSTQTTVLPSAGAALGIVRLVGTAPIEDGPNMDISMYIAVYTDKVAVLVFFGAPADVQAQEDAIVQMMDSLTFP